MRSPLKMFCIVFRYWTGIDRSNPHWWRIAMSWVFETLWPPSRSAGSPLGITLKIRNVITEMANRTTTMPMSLRTTKRAISVLQAHPRARVERVAHALAEDVQRQHREHEHQPRHDREVGRGDDPVDTLTDHLTPGGVGRLHARTEERQRGLQDDRVGHRER